MATPERTLLVVNFRSADLTRAAIDSARLASSVPLQVVVVDNSESAEEARRLHGIADELLIAERNLGFGGGINHALSRCRAEVLVIANPDVIFFPGSIDRLAERLSDQVGMSGPKMTWDDAGRWLMPPSESATRLGKASQAVATRVEWWQVQRSRLHARERVHFWTIDEPTVVDAISGAVMCVRRDLLESLGGFDPRFVMYFEEIDLARRLRKVGKRVEYVPAARCRHIYNQSAAQTAGSKGNFAASERAYHVKWNGQWFVRLIDRVARHSNILVDEFQPLPADASIPIPGLHSDVLVEASPLPNFDSATGHFPAASDVRFPREVWQTYRDEVLFLRVLERDSLRVVSRYRMEKLIKMESP